MIAIDGRSLTLEILAEAAHGRDRVKLAPSVAPRLRASRLVIEDALRQGDPVYGVNTGFGELKNQRVGAADLARLQLNLLRSHATGTGAKLSREETRALGLLRANSLAAGASGVREELVQALLAMLNAGVHPVVPEQGSVGASGDLAPLAHFALVLVGEGKAEFRGDVSSGRKALAGAGLRPAKLAPKEGLALINGTQLSTAITGLVLARGREVLRAAIGAGAMSLEALLGSTRAFDPRAMAVRPHPGQAKVARALLRMTKDSAIVLSHADCDRIQDPYSLRCMPQVLGASVDALAYARAVIEREMNSATDNPLVFAGGDVISAGNFHAQPVALVADHAATALAEVGSIAERRLDLMTDARRSSGLPPFLTPDPGLHSGLMLVQYTAAALVSENKTLCFPAVVDSIPTSAGQEDHVSMAPIAARKARAVLRNLSRVVACELVTAAQALEFRGPKPGRGTRRLHAWVRERVPRVEEDRPLGPAIESLAAELHDGAARDVLQPFVRDEDLP